MTNFSAMINVIKVVEYREIGRSWRFCKVQLLLRIRFRLLTQADMKSWEIMCRIFKPMFCIYINEKQREKKKRDTERYRKSEGNRDIDLVIKVKCWILPCLISSKKLPEVFNEFFFISKISKIRPLFDSSRVPGQSNCGPSNTNVLCIFRSLSCDELSGLFSPHRQNRVN